MTDRHPTSSLKDHPGALYLQIAAVMRRRISVGEWKPGQQLPTLEELSQEFGVARVTVRQAVGLLEGEELIWRKQGKGTFVSDNVGGGPWVSVQTEWSALVDLVDKTSFRQLAATKAMPPLIDAEGILAPGYRYFRRVYTKAGTPYALLNLYLDEDIYTLAPKAFSAQPVITVLNSLAEVEIARAFQRLTIGTADLEVAKLLNISLNSPVAEIRRIIKDPSDRIIYCADITYRGEFVKLDINLK